MNAEDKALWDEFFKLIMECEKITKDVDPVKMAQTILVVDALRRIGDLMEATLEALHDKGNT